jgi:hypothetical protein
MTSRRAEENCQRENKIYSVGRLVCEAIKAPPFFPEKNVFFSVKIYKNLPIASKLS